MHRFLLVVMIAAVMAACVRPAQTGQKPVLTVSILPEKYFVSKIAGNGYDINVMIPPGASPVTYEPLPSQMSALGNSTLYFRIGKIVFEEVWMKKIHDLNPGLDIEDLSRGIVFIGSGHHPTGSGAEEGADPHIWMSPVNAKMIAGNVLTVLSAHYPSDSALFRQNYRNVLSGIERIDSMYRAYESELRGQTFLIYHPALTYLARDYGMEQVSLEYEGKEPPPAHLSRIIDLAREKNITRIFVQKQFNLENARSLAGQIHGRIVTIDPLAEDWDDEMVRILQNLINT